MMRCTQACPSLVHSSLHDRLCTMFIQVLWSDPDRAGWAECMLAHISDMIMAKNKPADNQFALHEKYLARLIVARWASLPTVGPV